MASTLTQLSRELAEGRVSSKEATRACLDAAKANAERTHAYVSVDEGAAMMMAAGSDERRQRGEVRSPLDGVPIAVKDNIMVVGSRCTAGSNIIKDYVAPYDATVVARLKAAGAVILGKTNMDEFAMGSSTETSCHGPTANPWDPERIPGGSSGGSAVAVAEGSAVAALGSDTGGSIRQPASMCGVVGLKPTYGRVSRYGLIAMASSLDQIGPMTRSVDDAELLLSAIEGHDPMDGTSVDLSTFHSTPDRGRGQASRPLPAGGGIPPSLDEIKRRDDPSTTLNGLKVGLPKEYFVSGMDKGVETAVRGAVSALEQAGAEIVEVSLPHAEYALAVYYVLMPSEVSANLSRFDGIRYGGRQPGATLEETYRRSRGAGFGQEARRRIMLGTYALSSGYYDAYYLKALKVRRLIADDFAKAFTRCDVIATPVSPTTAWKLGEKLDDPLSMYLSDVYTVSINVAGVPAISVPCGLSGGLPVGLQLVGRQFDEKTLLGVARAYEATSGWKGLEKSGQGV